MPTPVMVNTGDLPPLKGNAYESYLRSSWGFVGYVPGAGRFANDLAEQLRETNDVDSWAAFATGAMADAWAALPSDFRAEAVGQLRDFAMGALDGLSERAPQLADAMSGAVEAAPIIGQLIGGAIRIIADGVSLSKKMHSDNLEASALRQQLAQLATLRQYKEPSAWVFHSMHVVPYVNYGSGKKYRLRPSFDRGSVDTDLMFRSVAGAADQGKCWPGRLLKCPTFFDANKPNMGCSYDAGGPNCMRYLSISALFYPYWSPAYAATPVPVIRTDASYDVNQLLIERQGALLLDPRANLRVRQADLLAMLGRFDSWWDNATAGGLVRIAADGSVADDGERLRIVKGATPNYVPTSQNKNRFYYDADSQIHAQQHVADELDRWGVPARGGAGLVDGKHLGVTLAQYNAVVGMVQAFMSARANMIRDGALMRAILTDNASPVPVDELDPKVRAAVEFASSQGRMLPSPRALTGGDGGAIPLVTPQAPGGVGGGGLLAVAASAAALFLLR